MRRETLVAFHFAAAASALSAYQGGDGTMTAAGHKLRDTPPSALMSSIINGSNWPRIGRVRTTRPQRVEFETRRRSRQGPQQTRDHRKGSATLNRRMRRPLRRVARSPGRPWASNARCQASSSSSESAYRRQASSIVMAPLRSAARTAALRRATHLSVFAGGRSVIDRGWPLLRRAHRTPAA